MSYTPETRWCGNGRNFLQNPITQNITDPTQNYKKIVVYFHQNDSIKFALICPEATQSTEFGMRLRVDGKSNEVKAHYKNKFTFMDGNKSLQVDCGAHSSDNTRKFTNGMQQKNPQSEE